MKPVFVVPLAEEDAADAAEWYESRASGVGADFLEALSRAMKQVSALPASGSVYLHASGAAPIRRVLISGFPYAVCSEEQ